jgi:hypothetical protein
MPVCVLAYDITGPPFYIDVKIDVHGEHLSRYINKPYTKSGKFIDYIVWPVLYLFQGGYILKKGIAQGMNEVVSDDIIVSMEEDKAVVNIDSDLEKSKDNDMVMCARSNGYITVGNYSQSLRTDRASGKKKIVVGMEIIVKK